MNFVLVIFAFLKSSIWHRLSFSLLVVYFVNRNRMGIPWVKARYWTVPFFDCLTFHRRTRFILRPNADHSLLQIFFFPQPQVWFEHLSFLHCLPSQAIILQLILMSNYDHSFTVSFLRLSGALVYYCVCSHCLIFRFVNLLLMELFFSFLFLDLVFRANLHDLPT